MNGSWELAWPLLGLQDPDDAQRGLTAPAEQVALVALAKERKLLAEAAARAKSNKGSAASSNAKKEKEDA